MNFNYFPVACIFGILASFVNNIADGTEAIIGGQKAAVDQFPYQVLVKQHELIVCGGGIIGDKFILTTAHCFIDNAGEFEDKNNISVLAGTNDFTKTGKPAEIIKVQKIYLTTKFVYDSTPNRCHFDIAVLRLEHPLKLTEHILKKSKHIQQLELPKNNHEIYDGKTAVIAGFGWNWCGMNGTQLVGGWTDSQLRFAETDIVSNKDCATDYNVIKLSNSVICARVKHHDPSKRYSACFGDSGSPLVHENTVIGLLSCGPDCLSEKVQPSMYIRIGHFLDFIQDAMKDKKTRDILPYDVKH